MNETIASTPPDEMTTSNKDSTSTVATGETESKEREEQVKVAPFSDNLGREDLNQLANKVNEIIQFINEQ